MDNSDDRNKLCDLLTLLVAHSLPPEERHNTDRLTELAEYVFLQSDLPTQVAALVQRAKKRYSLGDA